MYAELRTLELNDESWSLYIDNEHVGEIYKFEKGAEICRMLNQYHRVMASQKIAWDQALDILCTLAQYR